MSETHEDSQEQQARRLWERYMAQVHQGPPPCPDALLMASYLDGMATPEEADPVEGHLGRCAGCRRTFRELKQILAEPVHSLPAEALERAKAAVLEAVREENRKREERLRKIEQPIQLDRLRLPLWRRRMVARLAAACLALAALPVLAYVGYELAGALLGPEEPAETLVIVREEQPPPSTLVELEVGNLPQEEEAGSPVQPFRLQYPA